MIEAVAYLQRSVVKEAVAYFSAIVAAEVVTMFLHPLWGVIGHAVVMVTAVVCSARSDDRSHQRFILSLALVPLVRVVDLSLSLSLLPVPTIGRFPIVYAPLAIASVALVRTLGYQWREVGLNFQSLPAQLGMASSGLVFGWVEYLILKPEPMIAQLTWSSVWPPALILLAFTGFTEEFAFRGVLQRGATGVFSGLGIVYVSALFAILHIGFHSLLDVVFVFGVAMFFGWAVKRTGSLLGVSLAHGLTNIMLFLVLPFT